MSLRSASPCTSTSRPSVSCLRTASAISARMRSRYSSAPMSPRLKAARVWRMAAVCGNEPMVVVGSSGSCSAWRWRSMRCANGLARRAMSAVTPARRCCTRGLTTRRDCRREACTASDAASCAATAASPWLSAHASTCSSSSFSVAKASHDFSSASRRTSCASDTGTCSNEQEGASHRRSPSAACTGRSVSSTRRRSVRQILRPSMTPADSTACAGSAACHAASWPGARTRSIWKPSTGSAAARAAWSAAVSKYVASSSFGPASRRPS
ncbi:hypothetical protein D9M70_453190 [compost metagenome]